VADEPELSGRWAGHYHQHGQVHPISMELTQQGEGLRGTMHDGQTVTEKSVFEVAVEAGLEPGADERIAQSLRAMFPESPNAPIRARSELAPLSLLEGHVRGRDVYFLKRYLGECFFGYQVGDRRVGQTTDAHAVHYRGRLAGDGRSLAGRWWIDTETPGGVVRTEGEFELRRVSPPLS
jgi:hypothetical protein